MVTLGPMIGSIKPHREEQEIATEYLINKENENTSKLPCCGAIPAWKIWPISFEAVFVIYYIEETCQCYKNWLQWYTLDGYLLADILKAHQNQKVFIRLKIKRMLVEYSNSNTMPDICTARQILLYGKTGQESCTAVEISSPAGVTVFKTLGKKHLLRTTEKPSGLISCSILGTRHEILGKGLVDSIDLST